MTRIIAVVFTAAHFFFAVQVMAAEGEIRTCALTKAYECTPDEGCKEWTIQEMSLPRFLRIDLAAKTITSLDKDLDRTTKIATVDRKGVQGLVVMHGTELRGWSMVIGEDSGNLTLSASGDDESFVAFGSCIKP